MGLVLVKSLLQHWRSSVSPMVSTLQLCPMLCVAHSTPLFELLRIFQVCHVDGRRHLQHHM